MKKKIKVLHVLNLVGGVEICFRQICQNIDESIIETSVVCQKLGNKPKLVTSKEKEITPLSKFQLSLLPYVDRYVGRFLAFHHIVSSRSTVRAVLREV